jgi:integrase
MGLRWEHVDLEGGWLCVPCELRKGKGEDKVFRLAGDTMLALARIRRNSSDFVFPWPYTKSSLWPRYAQLLKAAGLPHDKRSKFHRMRRTVASYFEAAGGDATVLLGHSARAVTTKHYIDERIVKPKQAAELLFRPDLAEAAVAVAARSNSPQELLKLGTGVIDVTR